MIKDVHIINSEATFSRGMEFRAEAEQSLRTPVFWRRGCGVEIAIMRWLAIASSTVKNR